MRSWRKVLGRLTGAVVGLTAVGLVTLVSPVDDRPYLRTPYHSNTVERLVAGLQVATNGAAPAPLRAGWTRVKLTPLLGAATEVPERGEFRSVPLAGYGARKGAPATGVREDVWVKAVAVESGGRRVVFVGVEALIVPREVADSAVQELGRAPGLRRDEIYFGATHTHSSIGGWGEGVVAELFAGEFQPGVRTWMTRCLVDAVRGALERLEPAEVADGVFHAPGQVRNRLVGGDGRVDDGFEVLVLRHGNGERAVLGSFAAHATVLGAGNMEFSGDYPGRWAAEVEARLGGMAVFLAGGVGSHSARTGDGDAPARMDALGRRLGEATATLVEGLRYRAVESMTVAGVVVDLPPLNLRVQDDFRLRPWVAQHLLPVRPDTFLQGVRLGSVVWVSTPCDFSGELALGLKEHAAVQGRRLNVTSFNGDYIGYVIPTKYYHLGGYEPQTMSFHGPATADYLEELVRRLADGL